MSNNKRPIQNKEPSDSKNKRIYKFIDECSEIENVVFYEINIKTSEQYMIVSKWVELP